MHSETADATPVESNVTSMSPGLVVRLIAGEYAASGFVRDVDPDELLAARPPPPCRESGGARAEHFWPPPQPYNGRPIVFAQFRRRSDLLFRHRRPEQFAD